MGFKKCKKEVVKYGKLSKFATAGAVVSGAVAIGGAILASIKYKQFIEDNELKHETLKNKRDELTNVADSLKGFGETKDDDTNTTTDSLGDDVGEFKNVMDEIEDLLAMISSNVPSKLNDSIRDLEDKISMFQEVCEEINDILSDQSIPLKERYGQALSILKDMELEDVEDDEEGEDDNEGIDD